MKVAIKPGTKKQGLILKSEIHTVQVTVQMTEEEKAACTAAGILQQEMFSVPFSAKSDRGFKIDVASLVRGLDTTADFPDFLAASEFSVHVKEMLVNLKTAIEAKINEADEEFEL